MWNLKGERIKVFLFVNIFDSKLGSWLAYRIHCLFDLGYLSTLNDPKEIAEMEIFCF